MMINEALKQRKEKSIKTEGKMKKIILRIKSANFFNRGIVKKIKDKIYFKYINPKEEGRTDKYRLEIFNKLSEIFEETDWMLFCGGFLRFYRDKTMEGQDIDIGVKAEDIERVLPKFIEKNFLIKQVFYNNQNELTEYKLLYNNVEIDVFKIYFNNEEGYYHYFTLEDSRKKNVKLDRKIEGNKLIITGNDYISWKRRLPEFKVKEYEYCGAKFKGPENAVENIVALYGEGWTVYDPNYDPRVNPENNKPIPFNNAKSIVYTNAVTSIDNK